MSEALGALSAQEPSAKYLVQREPALIRGFELLATSAGAIAKLRDLILSLAVQGRLVPQETKDSPAEFLLTQIRMGINGQAKALDAEPALIARPFAVPSTWEWTQLGEVVEVIRGITFPASEKTREPAPNRIACLRTTNVQHSIEWEDLLFVDRSFMGREDQLIRHHDIVMSMANSRELVGKVALIEHVPHSEATFGGFLGVLRPHHIEPRYVMAVLRTRYARTALIGSASQTTNIANISLGKLRPLPFPLPPLAEQHRIVARVEELMKLCDALEQSGRLADAQHARLTSTLFDALAASESAHALAENWQRIAEHFDLLLDRPEAIDALEQTILQLAVRGMLVSQFSGDESAEALLRWFRRSAVDDRASRRGSAQPLPALIADEERPFDVPPTWAWARFASVAEIASNLVNPLQFQSARQVAPDCIEKATGRLVESRSVRESGVISANHRFLAGQILYSKIRPSLSKVVVVDFDGLCSADMYPIETRMQTTYLQLFMLSGCFLEQVKVAENRVKMPKLNQEALNSFLVAVPPFAEQHRIVARVEELRRLCAQLRERLTAARLIQSNLADALVSEAVA